MRALVIVALAIVVALSVGQVVDALPDRQVVDALPRSSSSTPYCFPKWKWDADDKDRPCVTVARLYEDASLRIRVHTAAGVVIYRRGIGNPKQ